MRVLENLEPKKVFHFFEDLTQIPRGSGNEKAVSDYCVKFAKDRGLEVVQDDLYNVIIKCPATEGYEDVEGVILQGHLDMVCEKSDDSEIDFEKDPLKVKIEDDYVTADGTTLGGDDGIAISYALAVMDSKDIPHPYLEAVFTVSEETGMDGANGIDLSGLKNRRLINIDNEDEGVLLTSCAGGCRVECVMPFHRYSKSGIHVSLKLKDLTGGHSGMGIINGGANANVMMARIADAAVEASDAMLISMNGGSKDNAIPRASMADFIVDKASLEAFKKAAEEEAGKIEAEYIVQDPYMTLEINEGAEETANCVNEIGFKAIKALILSIPNGVQAMSSDVENLVETSLNLGVLATDGNEIKLTYAVRSSKNSAKEFLVRKIQIIAEYFNAKTSSYGDYPAWEYRKDSRLRDDMVRIYKELFKKEPKVQAIHAGVECGLISDKLDNIDAVSFGPQMSGVHTTEEKLSISSTQRTWEYLCAILAYK
ncbi:MAG: aminoacyl-histidine dipeptidase [Lachnospiraceae bacterium]|nr:aminoacyl-histidine dipeptidase [Lachnospiraceae bacterium]